MCLRFISDSRLIFVYSIFFLPQISTLMEVEKDFLFFLLFRLSKYKNKKIINRKLTDLFADLPSINNRRNSIKMEKTILFDFEQTSSVAFNIFLVT